MSQIQYLEKRRDLLAIGLRANLDSANLLRGAVLANLGDSLNLLLATGRLANLDSANLLRGALNLLSANLLLAIGLRATGRFANLDSANLLRGALRGAVLANLDSPTRLLIPGLRADGRLLSEILEEATGLPYLLLAILALFPFSLLFSFSDTFIGCPPTYLLKELSIVSPCGRS